MQRYRQIGAAPRRSASETWSVITALIADTLQRSPVIAADDVAAIMDLAAPAGRMLIAAGHLDRHAVVVAADPVDLSITTVSGAAALALEENLAPVPGGATATNWMVYLPAPEPLTDAVRRAVAGSAHLRAGGPALRTGKAAALTAAVGPVDLEALARREADR
ncbi:MAG TPA: hypothetical protein VMC83_39430 [Streptosporangiaceae bacterium]|nr:hypothetical protein [Streptosporangiaceae bacterium]